MLGIIEKAVNFMKPVRAFFAGVMVSAALAFFIVPALAQEAADVVSGPAVEASASGGFGNQLMVFLLGLLVSSSAVIYKVVAKLINRGGDALDMWVRNKIENEFLEGAILRVTGFIRAGALNTYTTSYKAIKADLQAKLDDGKITKEEFAELKKNAGAEAKAAALTNIKAMTPRRLFSIILGKDAGEATINNYLGAALETVIADEKTIAKAAANGSGTVKN